MSTTCDVEFCTLEDFLLYMTFASPSLVYAPYCFVARRNILIYEAFPDQFDWQIGCFFLGYTVSAQGHRIKVQQISPESTEQDEFA
jgi:hypothetical protein